MLELGYVGETGIHQPYGTAAPRQCERSAVGQPDEPRQRYHNQYDCQCELPCADTWASPRHGLRAQGTEGNFKSNDLQVTVRKQMSHGLQLQGAYTWIRAFTTPTSPTIRTMPPRIYGLNAVSSSGSGGYRPQRFVFNYSWDLPFGNPEGIKGKLVQGWNLSGVTIAPGRASL